MTTTFDPIDQSVRVWTYEPEKARRESSVTAFSHGSEAVLSSGSLSWRTDLPASLGGSDASPSPTQMLLGALAGCAVVMVKDTLAPQLGITVDAVEATASCQTDERAQLGMDGVKPELRKLKLDVQIKSPSGDAAVEQLSALWRERCPIVLTVTNPTELTVTFAAA